jgi:glycosyltransferase involved in cell wall biosynthesis
MASSFPLVSIGFPVYNGGRTFVNALESLLAQTYTHFELIISDNASSDGTWERCQEYAARDSRIKLARNPTNLGALSNFTHVLETASGKYFMWAAHDDIWYPDFIRHCVEQLETHPGATLCYSQQLFVHYGSGKEKIQSYSSDLQDIKRWKRVFCLLTHNPIPYAIIYGLFRRDAIVSVLPIPLGPVIDLVILLRVLLQGPFTSVPIVLYRRNVQPKEFEDRMRVVYAAQGFSSSSVLFAKLLGELWKTVWHTNETLFGRLMMMWAATWYVIPRLIFQAIPRPVRDRIRILVRGRN